MSNFESKPKSIRIHGFCPLFWTTVQPCSTEEVRRNGCSFQMCLGPLCWPWSIQEIFKGCPLQPEEPPGFGEGGMEKGERSKGEGYTLYTQLIHLVQQKHNTGKKSYSNKDLMYAMSKDGT